MVLKSQRMVNRTLRQADYHLSCQEHQKNMRKAAWRGCVRELVQFNAEMFPLLECFSPLLHDNGAIVEKMSISGYVK